MKAFGKENPIEDYLQLSQAFVHYTNGLPLTIEVLGSFLFNKSRYEWIIELHRLKKFPENFLLLVYLIQFIQIIFHNASIPMALLTKLLSK